MYKTKRTILNCLLYFFLLVFLLASSLLITISLDHGSTQEFREHKKDNKSNDILVNPIDWTRLIKLNKDVYSWIYVPGTVIDYAVASSSATEPDDFYLDHNLYKNYKFTGMIFSQKENSKNFKDPVTVLYGHNMRNGSMFGDLIKFLNRDFFRSHKKIYIYMPGKIYVYKIIAAGEFDNENILIKYDFSKGIDKNYISDFEKFSNKRNISIKRTDHLLTLSTCASLESHRRIVEAILVHKYKKG